MLNPIRFRNKESGLTLIEMLIALVLGLFVTAVIISVFSTNVRSSNENIRMIRLNQELRGSMTLMVDELKRAGYSGWPVTSTFMKDVNFTSTCARYSYDENGDGTQDANERFGFRLTGNQLLWANNATGTGCTGGTWNPIALTDIASITNLNFNTNGSVNTNGDPGGSAFSSTSGVSIYEVSITLTGTTDLPHSTNDPSRTVTATIRIRNEDPEPGA